MFYAAISIFFLLFSLQLAEEVSSLSSGVAFSCRGRPAGYYADVDSGCQLYHMCDGLGRQFSYSCPNTTLFQQRMLICDHWYMVNCSKSEGAYSANLLIGQRNRPFVDDSDDHPYRRTPRPDLLTQPSAEERNIVYRTGRSQNFAGLNVVGAETDRADADGLTLAYNLPSYWSTDYSSDNARISASSSSARDSIRTDLPARATTRPRPRQRQPTAKAIRFDSNNSVNSVQSRPSKATNGFPRKSDESRVNFKSLFKATTPVFPTLAELSTTPTPIGDILRPPRIPSQSESHQQSPPDNILQENKFVSTNVHKSHGNANNYKTLENLREVFAIPDYEFPLEANGRPGYNGEFNSFQVNPLIVELQRPKERPV